jgi:hypothetical protein
MPDPPRRVKTPFGRGHRLFPKGDISKKDSTESGYGLIFEVSFLQNNGHRIMLIETSKTRPLPAKPIDIPLTE